MVDYSVSDNVAILTLNNPPVNALSGHVVSGLITAVKRAISDESVQALVITGHGKNFSAGADIKEFATMDNERAQRLNNLVNELLHASKPVIAAVKGFVFGGGLLIALAAQYTLAHAAARTGFPEVLIGILPAACGTQLLPRVVGLKQAADLVSTGRHISADEAKAIGLFDMVVSGDVLKEAIKFARLVCNKPIRRLYECLPADVQNVNQICDAALGKAAKRSPGLMAPVFCINAVRASVQPFDEGLRREADLAKVLFSSSQAKALQYAFFAERLAVKWKLPGGSDSKSASPSPVRSCGIVGGGTMGSGIAVAILNSGIPVTLVEQNQQFLDKSVAIIRGLYDGSVKLGKLSPAVADKNLKLLTPTTDWNKLKGVDLVVEAVYENLKLKKEIFKKLDTLCPPSTLLCTNTSYLDIDKIASVTNRPDKVMGTHFFVPAYYMKLLENVRGSQTSAETIATVTSWGTKIGKVPVLVASCPGFVGNRMLSPYSYESRFLVEEGCLPHQVDQVIKNFGIHLGPFEVADLSGLDIGYRSRHERFKALAEIYGEDGNTNRMKFGERYCALSDLLVERGRLGRKTGLGWYKYEKPGAKQPFVDPWLTSMIDKYCEKEGITRRHITPLEILERCLLPLINEGFKVLEEGIVTRPQDIDVIWLLGYGWPRHTGGPMFYAGQLGLKHVYDRVCFYSKQHSNSKHWEPSKLLARLASSGLTLDRWSAGQGSKL